jgi:hypothetical protein
VRKGSSVYDAFATLAQLDRALPSEGRGRRFDSCVSRPPSLLPACVEPPERRELSFVEPRPAALEADVDEDERREAPLTLDHRTVAGGAVERDLLYLLLAEHARAREGATELVDACITLAARGTRVVLDLPEGAVYEEGASTLGASVDLDGRRGTDEPIERDAGHLSVDGASGGRAVRAGRLGRDGSAACAVQERAALTLEGPIASSSSASFASAKRRGEVSNRAEDSSAVDSV